MRRNQTRVTSWPCTAQPAGTDGCGVTPISLSGQISHIRTPHRPRTQFHHAIGGVHRRPPPKTTIRLPALRYALLCDFELIPRALLLELVDDDGMRAPAVMAACVCGEKARPDVLVSDLGMTRGILPAVALTAFVQKDDAHLARFVWVSSPRAKAHRPARPDIRHCQARGAQPLA